jgi:membrane-associated phospholipid phosphatase
MEATRTGFARGFAVAAFAFAAVMAGPPRAAADEQATGVDTIRAAVSIAAQQTTLADEAQPSADDTSRQLIGKPAGAPPIPPHTGIKATLIDFVGDFKHLPSMQNLLWVSIGTGATAAVHPADKDVTPDLVNASWAHKVFGVGAVLGQSYTLMAAATTIYVTGRVTDNRRYSHMGSDLIQSLGVAEALTQVMKVSVGRQRPDGTSNSFPSGHAADTFAFATAIERHYSWKFAGPAYAFASYVAISRLHDNRHYLSDVVAGAAVGVIAGRTVTRHGQAAFPVAVAAVPGGAAVVYVRNGK